MIIQQVVEVDPLPPFELVKNGTVVECKGSEVNELARFVVLKKFC
jgi:hypothetical protein